MSAENFALAARALNALAYLEDVERYACKIAKRRRAFLDQALLPDPGNPWALSSSAAWHLEVARRAGEGRFGADPELGFQQCRAAHAVAPENLMIAYECALRLIAYDRAHAHKAWRDEGLPLLEVAVASSPVAALDVAIQERANLFHQAISQGEHAELSFIKAQP